MKTFKQYIHEMPLPKGLAKKVKGAINPELKRNLASDFKSHYDSRLQFDYEKYFRTIKELFLGDGGTKLGSGSSRIAISLPIDSKLFSREQLVQLGLELESKAEKDIKKEIEHGQLLLPGIEIVQKDAPVDPSQMTCVKIAMNPKGVLQNQAEVEMWNKYKNEPDIAKWLCPIIDTSAKILKTPNGKGSLFVQMPICHIENIEKKLNDFFGDAFYDTEHMSYAYADPHDPSITKHLKDRGLTEEQIKNTQDFIMFLQDTGIADIHDGNFGMLNDRIVMIDYAYAIDRRSGNENDVATAYQLRKIIKVNFGYGDVTPEPKQKSYRF